MAHIEGYTPENDQVQIDKNVVRVLKLHLIPLTADPTDLEDGDVWHRGDLNTIRARLNGATVTVTVS